MTSEETQLLALVSNEKLESSDVIICLEGDNYLRADKSCELFKEKLAPIILISGGIENAPVSIHARKMKQYLVEKKGLPEFSIELEEKSQNTREQAVEVMKIIKEKKWKKIILVASEFHQPRAFLTFLKAMNDDRLKLRIVNAPSIQSWSEEKTLGQSRQKLLIGEFEKIKEYYKKGDVASIKEGIEYQTWKEQK